MFSELVAMQQDWESVEEGGWEDGDSLVRKEGCKEGCKEGGKRGECKVEKKRATTLYVDQEETPEEIINNHFNMIQNSHCCKSSI